MGSTIDLTAADGHKLSAYVAGPSDAKKGLVVIQEIFGVNRHMRNVVDRFAAQGYAVCAPALAAGRGYRMKLTDAGHPGAGHGFGCDERGSFSKSDADLAQQPTLAFFTGHLG